MEPFASDPSTDLFEAVCLDTKKKTKKSIKKCDQFVSLRLDVEPKATIVCIQNVSVAGKALGLVNQLGQLLNF